MPRSPTTADVFNAIAEPRRRAIVDVLAGGRDWPVGAIVATLNLSQPAVSKHLAVLREVGIVAVTRRGRQRMYRLNADELRPIHDWVKTFERFWGHHLARIKQRAERRHRGDGAAARPNKEH
jgi:DNA-binding transcriptional ArsR family regulator